MDIKQIRTIIDLMKKNDLSLFSLEEEGVKITLKRGGGGGSIVSAVPVAAPQQPAVSAPAAVTTAPAPAAPSAPVGRTIDSPMVGTFYRAPSPDAEPFVKVGDRVTPDTVLCIIEAMKVMNEIKAETEGVIAEILVENGKPVMFGEPMFLLK